MPMPAIRTTALATPFLNRRRFLALGGAAALMPFLPQSARAFAAATHKTMVGDIALTAISDGSLTLPPAVFGAGVPEADFAAALTQAYGTPPAALMPETNHAILTSGSDVVLVDTGSGPGFQPSAGKLMAHLSAAGIDPGTITRVVFTHAHPDHIWGTLGTGGALNFPNATYYVGGAEFDFWTSPDTLAAMPEDFKPFVIGATRDLKAIEGRMVRVKEGDMVAPGISVLDTPGHTPGHIALLVEGGDGLVISGDVAANEFISLAHPDWVFGFDAIPEMAIATRRALLDRIATDGHRMMAYHFAWPGIGRVERAGDGFRYMADAG